MEKEKSVEKNRSIRAEYRYRNKETRVRNKAR